MKSPYEKTVQLFPFDESEIFSKVGPVILTKREIEPFNNFVLGKPGKAVNYHVVNKKS